MPARAEMSEPISATRPALFEPSGMAKIGICRLKLKIFFVNGFSGKIGIDSGRALHAHLRRAVLEDVDADERQDAGKDPYPSSPPPFSFCFSVSSTCSEPASFPLRKASAPLPLMTPFAYWSSNVALSRPGMARPSFAMPWTSPSA